MSELVRSTTEQPNHAAVARVAAVLESGGTALVPTETVYGIAARLDRPDAVHRIFDIKGRRFERPLQVLVASADEARRLAASWPEGARRLAEAFWPGPLTLVTPALPGLPDGVAAEDGTVGIRCPAQAALLALLKLTGPLAASSANRSGNEPAVTCHEAVATLGESVEIALDGGRSERGVPSTVIRLGGDDGFDILRHGALSFDELAAALGLTDGEPTDA